MSLLVEISISLISIGQADPPSMFYLENIISKSNMDENGIDDALNNIFIVLGYLIGC